MTYAQQVIENVKGMTFQEEEAYLTQKISELDEQFALGKALGTPVKAIDQAIQDLYEYILNR